MPQCCQPRKMATHGNQVKLNNFGIMGKRGQSQTKTISIPNADTKIFYKPSGTQLSPEERRI